MKKDIRPLYRMGMVSCTTLFLFLFLSRVLGSSKYPLPVTVNPKNAPKLSSNTHTFLSRNFIKGSDPLLQLRKPFMDDDSKLPPLTEEQLKLKELRKNLMTFLLENDTGLFVDCLNDLYSDFPDIDHANLLYRDEKSGDSRPLLHFAILTANSEMMLIMEEYQADPNLRDSCGFTALEAAHHLESSWEMIYELIFYFKDCILFPFLGYPTIVHYAAVRGRMDLLHAFRLSGNYDFSQEIPDHLTSPLEAALLKKQLKAIDYLLKYRAHIRKHAIEHIYIESLKQFPLDPAFPLFLVSRCPILIYYTDRAKYDLMRHAIRCNCISVVRKLFDNYKYDPDQVSYSILHEAVRLNASDRILSFIIGKMNIHL